MTLKEIADTLVEGCRTGQEAANLDKLYAADAVSIEAQDMGGMGRETKGLDGIKGKHAWWGENFEVHGGKVEGPFLHGDDRFAVTVVIRSLHFGGREARRQTDQVARQPVVL